MMITSLASVCALIPYALVTEGLVNPLAVNSITPALSFKVRSAAADACTNVIVGAIQIQAAATTTALDAGVADVWDSGRMPGNRTHHITFGSTGHASPLAPMQRVFWRARAWPAANPSAAPSPAAPCRRSGRRGEGRRKKREERGEEGSWCRFFDTL